MVPIPTSQGDGGMRSEPVCDLLVPVPSRELQVGGAEEPLGVKDGPVWRKVIYKGI